MPLLAASAAACLPAVGTAIAGLFAMWVGRVLATIAEIAWFASPENPARGNADPPGGEPPRTPR